MRKFTGLFLSIILFSSFLPVFADQGYFDDSHRLLYQQPTICIFEPNDIELSENTWNNWHTESKKVVDEWENRLKNSSPTGNWNIEWVEIPKEKLEFVNVIGCDLKIFFVDSERTDAKGWITYSTKTIEIVRNQMTFCGKVLYEPYNFYIDSYCRGDDLERPKKMANTLKHELGHAFGLGHYVSNNAQLMQDWYDSPLGSPSIMTINSPDNEEVRQISQIDLQKILEIHGHYGFGKEKNQNPVFIYPEKVITEPEVSDIQNIQVKPYQTSSVKILGYIPEELYSRGTPVEFQITNPNGIMESFATMVNNRQYFEYPMMFDSESLSGTYEILVIYKGEFIQKNAINLSKSTMSNSLPKSPSSLITSTSSYLEKISITSENNEYYVKTFFGKINHPASSVRVTAENECPMKKQVFQKDFIVKTGSEISFSFYQTSQGKPSQCSIYFSISDFNGNVLDYFKADYSTQETGKQPETKTNRSDLNDNVIQNIIPNESQDSKKQNVITESDLNWLLSKRDDTKKRLSDMEYHFKSSFEALKQSEKDFIGDIPKEHITKGFDVRLKLLKEFPEVQGLGMMIIQDIDTLEREQNKKNLYSISVSSIKKNIDIFEPIVDKMSLDMKYVSQEIESAKKAYEKLTPKTCFLFWCW